MKLLLGIVLGGAFTCITGILTIIITSIITNIVASIITNIITSITTSIISTTIHTARMIYPSYKRILDYAFMKSLIK